MTPILSYIIVSFTFVHLKIFLRIYIYVYIYIHECVYAFIFTYIYIYIGLKRLTVDVKSVFKAIQTSGFWMRSVEFNFWTERKIALVLHFFGFNHWCVYLLLHVLSTYLYKYIYIYVYVCVCTYIYNYMSKCLYIFKSMRIYIVTLAHTHIHTKPPPHTPEPPDKHRFHMINPTGDFDLNMCSFHMKSVQCKGQFLTMWSKHWVSLSIGYQSFITPSNYRQIATINPSYCSL